MEYENMKLLELKSLARDRWLRNYSQIRKAELVALLQNNGTLEDPRAIAPHTRPPPPSQSGGPKAPPPQRPPAYVTLKFDDNGCCRIHSISDGDKEIANNERYVVMPWKVVNRHGKNCKNDKHITLEEAVHELISYKESVDKEHERREAEPEEIERKCAKYYKVHMKGETEILNNWVDWYEVNLYKIREALVVGFECWRGYIESVRPIKIVE